MIADLRGRVAVVTGCLGGIGSETCRYLAEAGARVVGTDIAADPGGWSGGDGASYRRLDVTDDAGWRDLAASIDAEHGRLDILVNNAGIAVVDRLEDTSIADWRRVMAINVEGPFLGTQSCLDLLRRTGADQPFGASIVNISSIAGLVGTAFSSCYSASKGAVRLFTKSAAVEFASLGYKVRVNSVHPGVVQTAMIDLINDRYVETGVMSSSEKAVSRMPRPLLGRTAIPADIAKAVRFLASDEAGYMNGTEIVVDGGYTAK